MRSHCTRSPASPLVALLGGRRSELGSDSHEHECDHHEARSSVRDEQIQWRRHGASCNRTAQGTRLASSSSSESDVQTSELGSVVRFIDSHERECARQDAKRICGRDQQIQWLQHGAACDRTAQGAPPPLWLHGSEGNVQSSVQIHTNMNVTIMKRRVVPCAMSRSNGASTERLAIALHKEPRLPSDCELCTMLHLQCSFRFHRFTRILVCP